MNHVRQLTPNDLILLDRVLKQAKVFASKTGIPLEEVWPIATERAATRKRGGKRSGAGRPARDWKALTGVRLPSLPLRLVIEAALAETRDSPIDEAEAFRRALETQLPAENVDALYQAFIAARKKPSKAEIESHQSEREMRRRQRSADT